MKNYKNKYRSYKLINYYVLNNNNYFSNFLEIEYKILNPI